MSMALKKKGLPKVLFRRRGFIDLDQSFIQGLNKIAAPRTMHPKAQNKPN